MTKNINRKGQTRLNPFFEPYNTPHETIPFDKITLADYEEAMLEGIRREDEQIEKTINDPEEPTFENTLIRESWFFWVVCCFLYLFIFSTDSF